MKLAVDQDLIEAALHWAGRDPAFCVASGLDRADAERERLYEIDDEDERQAAFVAFHARWFRCSGLTAGLRAALDEFPLVVSGLESVTFCRVRSAKDEVAELFRSAEGVARAVFGLEAERFQERRYLPILRHECMHLHDMLDPAFEYPSDPSALRGADANSLLRQRYRVLWDASIDGRLTRRFPEFGDRAAERRRELDSYFSFQPENERTALFEDLWNGGKPTHPRLWSLASDPRHLCDHAAASVPGASCPLCGFATFAWADESRLKRIAPAVRSDSPGWEPPLGGCARCAEIYEARSLRLPATIVI